MQNQILHDNTVIYYVVRVNGQNVSQPCHSQTLAEMERSKLDPEIQQIAEVVPVTADGKELLLG